MKKYLPLTLVAIFFTVVLSSQFFDVFSTVAKKSSVVDKRDKLYEQKLKTLKVIDLEGKSFSYEQFKNKTVLVNFWATWCKPCLVEMPSLVELQNKLSDDIIILGVVSDEDDTKKKVSKVLKKYKINFPIIPFGKGQIVEDFMIQAIPVSILYHNGEVKKVFNGDTDFAAIELIEEIKKWQN